MVDDIQEILSTIDVEGWLDREGLDYRVARGKSGIQANLKECPCCGNSNWKVYIGLESALGNCFVCDTKFNLWKLIKSYLGSSSTRDVVEHCKTVAREQGWRPTRKQAVAVSIDKANLIIPESLPLPIKGRNLKYLENRSITSEVAKYFSLRYSTKGIFKYGDENGKQRVQSYAKRIIIPVFDLNGDIVSFQGRDITGIAEKKYLFPPGFASTGSHLYNGQNAHGAEDVVMGEGAFDVMATKIALDEEMQLRKVVPIGSFGKHLSHGDDESQLAKLMALREGGLKRVTMMWDSEPEALDAAIETGLLLRKFGLTARIAVLPAGRDPNEVAPSVVRNAFWRAEVVNEAVAVRIKLAKRTA